MSETTATASEETGVEVQMTDGRVLRFGDRSKMKKEYGVTEAGLVFCRIDFVNGETIQIEIDPSSTIGLQACGHGLSQKLGDAAAGADSIEDAFEAVLEIAKRTSNGEWTKARESGGGQAKGASELVTALAEVMGTDKDTIRTMLSTLSQGEKMGLRKVPEVASVIERLKAERAPSKKDAEKAAKGMEVLAALKAAAGG